MTSKWCVISYTNLKYLTRIRRYLLSPISRLNVYSTDPVEDLLRRTLTTTSCDQEPEPTSYLSGLVETLDGTDPT